MMGIWNPLQLFMLLSSCWTTVTAVSGPLLKYVQSKPFGNFFIAEGWRISDGQVNRTITARSVCGCRIACWTAVFCNAVSFQQVDGQYECGLTSLGPLQSTVIEDPDSSYIYWESTIVDMLHLHGMESDRLLYLVTSKTLTLNGARDFCNSIPGFRLGMYKTLKSYEVMKELAADHSPGYYRLDLKIPNTGDFIWGDQTSVDNALLPIMTADIQSDVYSGSSPASYAVTTGGGLMKRKMTHPEKVICQGNPLGIDW